MEKKINIAELLKHCPKGMELDCTMYEDVYFDYVDELNIIRCYIQHETQKTSITFNRHGTPNSYMKSKCVIFPKGKTTWEGFVPPCKFKDGDILYIDCADEESDGDVYKYIFILKEIDSLGNHYSYCHLNMDVFFSNSCYLTDNDYTPRFATEEEKEKLFKAIEDNGFKWNAETKTLEKLVELKFKEGDSIRIKGTSAIYVVTEIREDCYMLDDKDTYFTFKTQDEWELVPDKFDINALKPFESKVLVRNVDGDLWKPAIYGFSPSKGGCYVVSGVYWKQCIPYEANKELLGTVNNPEEYGNE